MAEFYYSEVNFDKAEEFGKTVERKEENYLIYIIQLVVNSLWTLLFFGFNLQFLSFLWIVLLIVLVITIAVLLIISFRLSPLACGINFSISFNFFNQLFSLFFVSTYS